MKDFNKLVTDFYNKYNPEKISDVSYLLEKYNGREEELLAKLYKKYNISPETLIEEEPVEENLEVKYEEEKSESVELLEVKPLEEVSENETPLEEVPLVGEAENKQSISAENETIGQLKQNDLSTDIPKEKKEVKNKPNTTNPNKWNNKRMVYIGIIASLILITSLTLLIIFNGKSKSDVKLKENSEIIEKSEGNKEEPQVAKGNNESFNNKTQKREPETNPNPIDSASQNKEIAVNKTFEVGIQKEIEGNLGQVTFSNREGKILFYFQIKPQEGKILINDIAYALTELTFNKDTKKYVISGKEVTIETSKLIAKNDGADCTNGTFDNITVTLNGISTILKNVTVQDCPSFD